MGDARSALARRIEHTLLKPTATAGDIEREVGNAVQWSCIAFCVHPCWTAHAATLADGALEIVSVTGFPFGTETPATKAHGAAEAVQHGASEIDMVIHQGAVKSGDWRTVATDVAEVRRAIPDAALKVILETGALTRDELERAARVCMQEGADFLKTCTGYGPRGATVEDVEILAPFGPVKASAGIRTREQAEALVAAGAARLGCSGTADILAGFPA